MEAIDSANSVDLLPSRSLTAESMTINIGGSRDSKFVKSDRSFLVTRREERNGEERRRHMCRRLTVLGAWCLLFFGGNGCAGYFLRQIGKGLYNS
jgi:hypothetical protein